MTPKKTRFQELLEAGIIKESNIKVYELSDYSYLERMVGNREVENRASKVIQNIKANGRRPEPCLVNENMEIINGQARSIAYEQLGLTYPFVLEEGAGLNECITMNQSTTAWKMTDYIHSFAVLGNDEYIELERLLKEYPEFSDKSVIFAASGLVDSATKKIQEGKYTNANRFIEDPEKALDFVNEMREALKTLKGSRSKAEQSLIFAYAIEDLNRERMIRMFNLFGYELKSYSSLEDWLKGISDIYNRNLKKGRIDLAIEYKLMMDKRYTWYSKKWGRDNA